MTDSPKPVETRPEPIAVARQRFASANLPFPYIPSELLNQLVVCSEWVFGTRTDTPGPYSIDWFVDEFLSGAVKADYLLFGQDGHGMNSYAMHYHLVHGPLALFDQLAWGGVYTDNQLAIELMAAHFAQIEGLIQRLDQALGRGLLLPGEYFVVVMSDFYGSRWARLQPGLLKNKIEWQPEADGLLTLLSALLAVHRLLGENV